MLLKLKSDAYLDKIALGHANGIIKAFGLKKKVVSKPNPQPKPVKDPFYRVVTASFKDKSNANSRVASLKKKGYDSFLDYHLGFYRVVTGSFNNRSNAEQRVDELKKKGFDSFIDVFEK